MYQQNSLLSAELLTLIGTKHKIKYSENDSAATCCKERCIKQNIFFTTPLELCGKKLHYLHLVIVCFHRKLLATWLECFVK
jgi:hypothetical protein